MISIIITAFRESKTIRKAVLSILNQDLPKHELIVIAPDEKTLSEVRKLQENYKTLRIIKDKGVGKSAALNFAFSSSRGDILVFTDGDVFVGEDSILHLLKPLINEETGAVSGKPVSLNPLNTKYGYWARLLTKIADTRRKRALKMGKRFFCTGYLFAIRKKLFPKLPENLLSEDGFISHNVYENGYSIGYSPDSEVYVKYPDNFSDWIKQKKRSAGGYNQIKKMIGVEIRSFKKESRGFRDFLKEIRNPLQMIWIFELFMARLYLWAIIYWDINIKKKSHKEIWKRVESTK